MVTLKKHLYQFFVLQAPQTGALLTESAPIWGADCAHSRDTGTVALPWHNCGMNVARSCHGRVTAVSRRGTDVVFHFTEQNYAPLTGPLPLVQMRTPRRKRCWGIIICTWFLPGFRPNLAPGPVPTGRALKMVQNPPKISPETNSKAVS